MDDRRQRVIISADAHDGLGAFGWEVADAAALHAMAARLEAAGHRVAVGSAALAARRRMAAAARGERAPVQVLRGNHTLMPGACRWWDGLRGAAE
jgi:hypothetical protein